MPWSSAISAFTLLEVILAVMIASGMLVFVLYFYQRVSENRSLILHEADRVSAARLLMDRLTSDLVTARVHQGLQFGLAGGTNSIDFLRTVYPDRSAWGMSLDAVFQAPDSDLHRIRFGLYSATDTNLGEVIGRAEEPFLGATFAATNDVVIGESDPAANETVTPYLTLTDQFHFLFFRYWTGTNWAGDWRGPSLPTGVEVTLGTEPLPLEVAPEAYPFEVFRRTIFLPCHAAPGAGMRTQGATNSPASPPSEELEQREDASTVLETRSVPMNPSRRDEVPRVRETDSPKCSLGLRGRRPSSRRRVMESPCFLLEERIYDMAFELSVPNRRSSTFDTLIALHDPTGGARC